MLFKKGNEDIEEYKGKRMPKRHRRRGGAQTI